MKKVFLLLLIACLAPPVSGCSPWLKATPDEPVNTFLDISVEDMRADVDKFVGRVFEDRIKYYQTYRSKEDAIPSLSPQVIKGQTYFTARPINQYHYVIHVQITSRQDKWIRKMEIDRQDALKARMRFAGISPDTGTLIFDLMEILETHRSLK